MDSFFGIGLPELLLILLLSGLVMGPHRIRHVARTLGRTTTQLQRVSRQFTRQLNSELDSLGDDTVRNSINDFRDLQREVQQLRSELGDIPKSLRSEAQELVDETEASLKKSSSTTAGDAITDPPDSAQEPATTSEQEPVATPIQRPISTSLPNPTAIPVPSLPKAIEVPEDTD